MIISNKKKAGFKEKREFEMLEKEIADLETENTPNTSASASTK